jgi:hypothetical protein
MKLLLTILLAYSIGSNPTDLKTKTDDACTFTIARDGEPLVSCHAATCAIAQACAWEVYDALDLCNLE